MKLSKEQIAQFVSYIDLADIKKFIEQNQANYERFLEFESKKVKITGVVILPPTDNCLIRF